MDYSPPAELLCEAAHIHADTTVNEPCWETSRLNLGEERQERGYRATWGAPLSLPVALLCGPGFESTSASPFQLMRKQTQAVVLRCMVQTGGSSPIP